MAKQIEKPLTREDVLKLIEVNGGTAEGLDLSGKVFEQGIDLSGLDLKGIILREATLWDIELEDPDSGYLPEGAHLEGASLMNAHLEDAKIFGSHLEGTDLFNAHLEGALLTEVHLEGANLTVAHLERTKLRGAHLEGASFAGVQLSSDTLLDDTVWGNYILGEEREALFDIAADSYRQLKQWYTNAGMYDVAGKFFYREMEARRKSRHWKAELHLKLWDWILRLLCGYGEKAERVVVSAVMFIFGLAAAYFFFSAFSSATFAGCLYYSVVSFTAVGYGSWVYPEPASWAKGFGAAEAALGVFMMALFLVTFTRKMTR